MQPKTGEGREVPFMKSEHVACDTERAEFSLACIDVTDSPFT